MTQRIHFLLTLLLGLSFLSAARAERIGNFEITVQPVNKEFTDATHYGGYGKEKTQTLIYKVRIDLKGTEKLENLQVLYIVAYKGSRGPYREDGTRGGTKLVQGKEELKQFTPFEKFEFNTQGVENAYEKWGRSDYGKAQLKGITIRIMQGGKKLAEFAAPAEMKDAWNAKDLLLQDAPE